MTEKDLIKKLRSLNQIKPNQDWVVLNKAEMFGGGVNKVVENNHTFVYNYKNIFINLYRFFISQKRLAYSFAVLVFVIAGGFLINLNNMQNNSAVPEKVSVKNDSVAIDKFHALKQKSQSLAEVVVNGENTDILAVNEIKSATRDLTEAVQNDSSIAKEVALQVKNDKALASIFSQEELKSSSDDLYRALDEQMIADLESSSLTQEQQDSLSEAKEIFKEGDFYGALEVILTIRE